MTIEKDLGCFQRDRCDFSSLGCYSSNEEMTIKPKET